jgi:hypothetical protein
MMQDMGVPATGSVAIGVAQRGVLQNPGGATGNLGGAATARRGVTRDEFRREVARQVQATQPQATQPQAGQTQAGQQQTGQQTGQQSGQQTDQQTGQQATGQQTGQQQTGQQTGQQATGQQQAGTPTTGNNPVASQLLLAPTFTPIQANAVLDQTNMRIAVPVRQVDGEYILTMQVMGGSGAPPAAAAPSSSQTPTAAEAPQSSASPSASAESGQLSTASNGTETAKSERRQESTKDKYGDAVPPQGAVIMTMKMIDQMAQTVLWGGQAPITQIMSEYVKAQTGMDLAAIANGTAEAGVKLIV